MPDGNPNLFTVTDLKQYIYCPRIVYYHTCLPDVRPTTRKMQIGIRRHESQPKKALRRTMNIPNIDAAERLFDVPVLCEELGLSGQIDEVILFDDHLIPVDYKLSRKAGKHFKLQVTAYAMLAEATFGLPTLHGLLYLIPARKAVEVNTSKHWRKKVREAIHTMRTIAERESMPSPTPNRRACTDCEFRRFCNDV